MRNTRRYSLKNGIFINEVLRGKFAALHDLIWDALVQRKINESDKIIPVPCDKIASLNSHGDELMKDLERIVHDRLWPKDSL